MSNKKNYLKNTADIGTAASEMLTLEPRIMLDAAAVATAVVALPIAPVDASAADSSGGHAPAAEAVASSDTATQDTHQNVSDPAAHSSNANEPTIQLMFVDPNIKNVGALMQELHNQQQNNHDSSIIIKIIQLDANKNGIQQITSIINQYDNVSSVQIFSEGNAGAVVIGNSILQNGNIELYSQQLQSWSTSLTANADILFYGCNVAQSADGISMLNKLADYTTADVAASTDVTGQTSLGGNYALEYHSGLIEATNPLSTQFMSSWDTTLVAVGVHTYSYTEEFPDGVITPGEKITIFYDYTLVDDNPGGSFGLSLFGNIALPSNMVIVASNLSGPNYNFSVNLSGAVSSGSLPAHSFTNSFYVQAIMPNPVPVGVESIFSSSSATLSYSSAGSSTAVIVPTPTISLGVSLPVIANPEISVNTFLATAGPVQPGDLVQYNVLVTNLGDQNANVTVTETVPTGMILASVPSNSIWTSIGFNQYQANISNLMGYNNSTILSLTLEVAAIVPAGVENTVSTISIFTAEDSLNAGDIGNHLNNTSTSGIILIDAAPDIQVTKSNNAGGSLDPGEQFTYTINVTNIGNQNALGVVLTETLAPGLIFNASLSPGWTQVGLTNQYTLTVNSNVGSNQNFAFTASLITSLPVGMTSVQNTVTATGGVGGEDSNLSNNTYVDTALPINAGPNLVVTKVVTNAVNAVLLPGDLIDYLITVRNIGNQAAAGVILTESSQGVLEAFGSNVGWVNQGNGIYTFNLTALNLDGNTVGVNAANGILEPGETSTIVYHTRVALIQPATIEFLVNTVTVAEATGIDLNITDNTFTTVQKPIDAEPDLIITKNDNLDEVNAITPIVYNITVTNLGDQNTTGVVIREFLPEFTQFDPTLSTPGWVNLGGGVYEFALSSLGVGHVNSLLTVNSTVSVNFALTFTDNVPQDLQGITNHVLVHDNTLSGIDRNVSNDFTSDSTFAIISTANIFHARPWENYFDSGRYNQLSEHYDYMNANDVINLASVTNISANLVGSRQAFDYDPLFGFIDFDNEHSMIARHASNPAITDFLVSDMMKSFPGNTPFMGSTSSNDQILLDVNQLSDQMGHAVVQAVTAAQTESQQAPGQQHSAANDPMMYHGFNEQVLQIANRFEQESINLSNAINRLMKP